MRDKVPILHLIDLIIFQSLASVEIKQRLCRALLFFLEFFLEFRLLFVILIFLSSCDIVCWYLLHKNCHRRTNTYQWGESTIRRVERTNWEVRGGAITHTVSTFVTPRVVTEARRHFACDTLEGAELENQGGEGTALTHWEKRIFENEAMTGVHTQNPVYSNMTLALLEDSGWYRPDYSVAGVVQFGAGLGCEFATKSCKSWIDNARKNG